MSKKLLIIGAGISGLATAALLAKDGYDVTILEKNDRIGGRAMVFEEQGFHFDMGPSWYQMPEVYENFFAHFGKKSSDFYNLKKLDPQYRMFFDDRTIDISSHLEQNLQLFETLEPGITQKLKKYLDASKEQYDIALKHILYRNFSSLTDFFNKEMMQVGSKMKIFENFEKYVSRLTSNKTIQKVLLYPILFVGNSPKNSPALFSLFSHIDLGIGVFYPMGGMGKFIEALKSLCDEYGVKIQTNQEVVTIEVKDKYAQKVITKSSEFTAEIIISNADYPQTEIKLLDLKSQTYPQKYWQNKHIAPSAFVIYLGIKGTLKNLQHHNLYLAENWEKHFNSLSKKDWPEHPSYYISCPSKTDPSVAPKDCENVFITVQISPHIQDTLELREVYFQKIISHLEKITQEKIQSRIIYKRIFSKNDYADVYNAYQGTAIGLSQTFWQTTIFRPQNKSKKVNNLYYVGQYTNPGIGMPMCLISAELVVKRINNITSS